MRWRSLRPPNVLLGETRQLCRSLVPFTLPYLGMASSMSAMRMVASSVVAARGPEQRAGSPGWLVYEDVA